MRSDSDDDNEVADDDLWRLDMRLADEADNGNGITGELVVADDFKLLPLEPDKDDDDEVPGDISEVGRKRIRYCEAAPNTSRTVDSDEETAAAAAADAL